GRSLRFQRENMGLLHAGCVRYFHVCQSGCLLLVGRVDFEAVEFFALFGTGKDLVDAPCEKRGHSSYRQQHDDPAAEGHMSPPVVTTALSPGFLNLGAMAVIKVMNAPT